MTSPGWRWTVTGGLSAGLLMSTLGLAHSRAQDTMPPTASTATPIRHLVVIFQENVSFDHYFGTYPHSADPAGEPAVHPAPGTPAVNGLTTTDGRPSVLLTNNPNGANPERLDRRQALTCDQDHDYTPEQSAFDHGLMDRFLANAPHQFCGSPQATADTPANAILDYYDGNTVTGLWAYAQRFAMSDNSYGTGFGPSTPGALNVVSAQTHGAYCGNAATTAPGGEDPTLYGTVSPCPGGTTATAAPGRPAAMASGQATVVGDPDAYFDTCSKKANTAAMAGRNIGDLLQGSGVTWGWFQGGFASPDYVPGDPGHPSDPATVCTGAHYNIGAGDQDGRPCVPHTAGNPLAPYCVSDYSAHHEPFQYYQSTANPTHLPPSSVAAIGHQDQANHQYDIRDFYAAAESGNLPAVSYLKARKFEDGHASYSDPLDEQHFIVDTVNRLQKLPEWTSTAVVIAYDDSDGWYDHQMSPVPFQSQTALDTLSNPGECGAGADQTPPDSSQAPPVPSGQQARCGYGPRLPLLMISPFARQNAVDHSLTDQSSVVRFIEDNWLGGRRLDGQYTPLGASAPQTDRGHVEAMAGTLDGLFDFSRPHDGRLFLDPRSGLPTGSGGLGGGR